MARCPCRFALANRLFSWWSMRKQWDDNDLSDSLRLYDLAVPVRGKWLPCEYGFMLQLRYPAWNHINQKQSLFKMKLSCYDICLLSPAVSHQISTALNNHDENVHSQLKQTPSKTKNIQQFRSFWCFERCLTFTLFSCVTVKQSDWNCAAVSPFVCLSCPQSDNNIRSTSGSVAILNQLFRSAAFLHFAQRQSNERETVSHQAGCPFVSLSVCERARKLLSDPRDGGGAWVHTNMSETTFKLFEMKMSLLQ